MTPLLPQKLGRDKPEGGQDHDDHRQLEQDTERNQNFRHEAEVGSRLQHHVEVVLSEEQEELERGRKCSGVGEVHTRREEEYPEIKGWDDHPLLMPLECRRQERPNLVDDDR